MDATSGPYRIRTYDRPVMSRMLSPTELMVHVARKQTNKNVPRERNIFQRMENN